MDVSYQYNMKKYLIISIMLCIVCGAEAKKWTQSEVIAIINKVNSYWQNNNPAEVSSFGTMLLITLET